MEATLKIVQDYFEHGVAHLQKVNCLYLSAHFRSGRWLKGKFIFQFLKMYQLWIKILVVVHLLQFQSKEKKSSVIKKFRNAFRTFLWQMMSNEKLSVEKKHRKSLWKVNQMFRFWKSPASVIHFDTMIPWYCDAKKLLRPTSLRICDTKILWCHNTVMPRYHYAVIQWNCDAVIPWYNYAIIPWCNGTMILWHHETMIPKRCDTIISLCYEYVRIIYYGQHHIQW